MLDAILRAGGATEMLPDVPQIADGMRLLVAEELLRRRWIGAYAPLRGDGRLVAIRDVRVTPTGEAAARRLRSISTTSEDISPVTGIEEKKRDRLLFMRKLYEVTNGSRSIFTTVAEVAQALDWDEARADAVAEYLDGEHLIEIITMDGGISITHYGVIEVETSMERPEQATQHFPPAVNIISIGAMFGSQVQQGTTSSTQSPTVGLNPDVFTELSEALKVIRGEMDHLVLDDDDRAELTAELATVEAQVSSPRPKAGVLKEGIARIAALAGAGATASTTAVTVVENVEKLHRLLPLV